MSLFQLILNQFKPGLNIRVNNLTSDGNVTLSSLPSKEVLATDSSGKIIAGSSVSNFVSLPNNGNSVLTTSQSGTTFLLGTPTNSITISLPAPTLGVYYYFYLIAPSSANFTRTIYYPTTAVAVHRGIYNNAGAAAFTNTASGNHGIIQLINTGVTGDWAYVWSDGTNWYFNTQSTGAGLVWNDFP